MLGMVGLADQCLLLIAVPESSSIVLAALRNVPGCQAKPWSSFAEPRLKQDDLVSDDIHVFCVDWVVAVLFQLDFVLLYVVLVEHCEDLVVHQFVLRLLYCLEVEEG